MKRKNLLLLIPIAVGVIVFTFAGCKKESSDPSQSASNSAIGTGGGGVLRGNASVIPAYYDSTVFRIQFVEFSPTAEAAQIAHNPGINNIWQSDAGLPNNQPFISVIDAIPGDGMNPVWRETQITFNQGHTPRQLYSDNDVYAAANSGEITLTITNEVYWCPIVGH